MQDNFEELLRRAADVHAQLREENARLRRELERRRRESPAPQGGHRGADAPTTEMRSLHTWERFFMVLMNLQETKKNLRHSARQQRQFGYETTCQTMAAAHRALRSPHDAVGAAQTYGVVHAHRPERNTRLWKAAAAGLRDHVLLRHWCEVGMTLATVEESLTHAYGEAYSGDLRSKIRGAYKHLFDHGPRTPQTNRRPARGTRPQRSPSRHRIGRRSTGAPAAEPAAEESPARRSAEESPEEPAAEWSPEEPAAEESPVRRAAEESPEEPAAEESPEEPAAEESPEELAAEESLEEVSAEESPAAPEAAVAGSSATPIPYTVYNTFVDVSDTRSSQCRKSRKSWPLKHPTTAKEKSKSRKTMDRLLRKLTEEHLPPEESSRLAVDLKALDWKSATVDDVNRLVQALRVALGHNGGGVQALQSILDAIWQVTDPVTLAAEAQADWMDEVVRMSLAAMERGRDSAELLMPALGVQLTIARAQARVLGVVCAPGVAAEARCRHAELQADLVGAAWKQHPGCRWEAVKVLARTQPWATLQSQVMAIGDAEDSPISVLVPVVMEELYYHMQDPLGVWAKGAEEHQCMWAQSVLKQLAEQQAVAPQVLPALSEWMMEVRSKKEMRARVFLNGILAGPDGILEPLSAAVGSAAPALHEDLMFAACRSIWELHDYVQPVSSADVDKFNNMAAELFRMDGKSGWAFSQFLRSAVVGAVGSLNRGRGSAAGQVLGLLLHMADHYMARWQPEAPFHHEVLWALAEIFQGEISAEWEKQVCGLAQKLVRQWSRLRKQEPEKACQENADERQIVELGNRILSWRAPMTSRSSR